MRFLSAEFYAGSNLLLFPILSLVLFSTVFAVVVFRTYGKRGRGLEAMGSLPLAADVAPAAHDEDPEGTRRPS